MNSFAVLNCVYDGTSGGGGDPNPLCCVFGSVNSQNLYPLAYFRYLMAASAANQMQAALTALMLNFYVYYHATLPWTNLIPFPSFPESNVVATQTGGPFPVAPVVVPQALIGSWTA